MTLNSNNAAAMPDVQGFADSRKVAINRVGVKNVVYPMRLATPDANGEPTGEQTSTATISMYVALPETKKGTHMSRFLEVLNDHQCKPVTPDQIPVIAHDILERLEAKEAHFEASFTYFIEKHAPVTAQPGLMNYEVTFACTVTKDKTDFVISVAAPATSLCPCSKEISAYGAHNQRCRIQASVRTTSRMWIEEIVELLEQSASHPVYAVLKRPDEKFVTEAAFDNPKFVEDIVRDLAVSLDNEDRISWYSISSENFESIHSHNAYAEITRDKAEG